VETEANIVIAGTLLIDIYENYSFICFIAHLCSGRCFQQHSVYWYLGFGFATFGILMAVILLMLLGPIPCVCKL